MSAAAKVTPLRPVASTPVYLSPAQVCELVPGLTPGALKELRRDGRGPRYRKPTGERGHVTVYLRDDVIAWVERSITGTRDQS